MASDRNIFRFSKAFHVTGCAFLCIAFLCATDASLGQAIRAPQVSRILELVDAERYQDAIDAYVQLSKPGVWEQHPDQFFTLLLPIAESCDRQWNQPVLLALRDQGYKLLHRATSSDAELELSYIDALYGSIADNNPVKAAKTLEAVIRDARSKKTTEVEAFALYKFGALCYTLGEFRRSMQSFSRAGDLFRSINNERLATRMLGYSGTLAENLGDYALAFNNMLDAIEISGRNNWTDQHATHLNNLGALYQSLDDPEQAFAAYQEASTRAKELGNRALDASALLGMAINLSAFRPTDPDIELYLEQALLLAEEVGHHRRIAEIYAFKALSALDVEAYPDALRWMNKLSNMVSGRGSYGELLELRARAQYAEQVSGFEKAFPILKKELQLSERIGDVDRQRRTLDAMGAGWLLTGHPREAVTALHRAITVGEQMRERLTLRQHQTSLMALYNETYQSLVGAYLELRKVDSAFAMMEQSRGRSLIDQFRDAMLTDLPDVSDSLRLELLDLQHEIDDIKEENHRVQSSLSAHAQRALMELENKRRSIFDRIMNAHPTLRSLMDMPLASITDVQQRLLQKGQLLLAYSLAEDKLNLIAIGRDEVFSTRVQVTRDSIQYLIDRLIQGMTESNPVLPDVAFDVSLAHDLYSILISPVSHLLERYDELLILPDNVAFRVPFEMLVSSTSLCVNRFDVDRARFLVEDKNISYALSATQLLYRQELPLHEGKGFFALGNPQAGSLAQRRFRRYYSSFRSGQRGSQFSFSMPSLRFAAEEVFQAGNQLLLPSTHILTGHEASKTMLGRHAAGKAIVHIAAHHVVDDFEPLYSRLFLAAGAEDSSGILELWEVARMKLMTQLVVLSACRSGFGKLVSGEGITSMARAFWLAGVPSIVVSMWNVDDRTSATLLPAFYQYLREGKSKAYALSQAKRDFLKKGERNPYYWAGFVLQGNADPLKLPRPALPVIPLTVMLLTLFLAGVLTAWSRSHQRN